MRFASSTTSKMSALASQITLSNQPTSSSISLHRITCANCIILYSYPITPVSQSVEHLACNRQNPRTTTNSCCALVRRRCKPSRSQGLTNANEELGTKAASAMFRSTTLGFGWNGCVGEGQAISSSKSCSYKFDLNA